MPAPGVIGVILPANNEEALLPACLEALAASAADSPLPVELVVVLDACTDASADVVAEFRARRADRLAVHVLHRRLRNVGRARAAGAALLTERYPDRLLWIATTDSDSTVPVNWLSVQLAHARDGAAAVVGTITVREWHDRSPDVGRYADALYNAGEHRHIHGANLAFSAAAYRRAGGFAPLACHEDVNLVRAMVTAGEQVVWATDLTVTTSARRDGRTGAGFAGYLDALEQAIA